MHSVLLKHTTSTVTASISSNILRIYLKNAKWIEQQLSDGFFCTRLKLLGKQTKRTAHTNIISYALCALGHKHGDTGKVHIFMVFKGSKAPVVYFSEFVANAEREDIGAKRKNETPDDERAKKKTRYEEFKENELGDYMQDVEIEVPELEDADDEIAIPDDNWSNILAFLSSESLSESASAVNLNAFGHSVNILETRESVDPIILFAVHGNETSLAEMLRGTRTSNRDVFTYALRESIDLRKFGCALILLKDGRADPKYDFADTEFVGNLDVLLKKRGNERMPYDQEHEAAVKVASEFLDQCLNDPNYKEFETHADKKVLSMLEGRYPSNHYGYSVAGHFRYGDPVKYCNALLHIETPRTDERSTVERILWALLERYEWSDKMVRYAMQEHYRHISKELFDMVSKKYDIKPHIEILRVIGWQGDKDLFLDVLKKQEFVGKSDCDMICTAATQSKAVFRHFIDTDMSQVDRRVIEIYARGLFGASCYAQYDVDGMRYLKKRGNFKLNFQFPMPMSVEGAPEHVVKYLIEEYMKDLTHEELKRLVSKYHVYLDYAIKHNFPDITGEIGIHALETRAFAQYGGPTEKDKRIIARLWNFALEHKCMDSWFSKILRSPQYGYYERIYTVMSYVLGESRYDPVAVSVEFIASMKTTDKRHKYQPFEDYKHTLIPLLSDSRIIAKVSKDAQLKEKVITMLKLFWIETPIPNRWPHMVAPVENKNHSQTLIDFMGH